MWIFNQLQNILERGFSPKKLILDFDNPEKIQHVIAVYQQWFITWKAKEHIPDYPNNEQNRKKFLKFTFETLSC